MKKHPRWYQEDRNAERTRRFRHNSMNMIGHDSPTVQAKVMFCINKMQRAYVIAVPVIVCIPKYSSSYFITPISFCRHHHNSLALPLPPPLPPSMSFSPTTTAAGPALLLTTPRWQRKKYDDGMTASTMTLAVLL